MKALRTILVALIALSVGILPIQAGTAMVGHASASNVMTQAHCCDQIQPCKAKTGGCELLPSCTLKCASAATAIMDVAPRISPLTSTIRLPLLVAGILAATDNPPLPPPRV
jgi:hypothetical protein